APCGMVLAGQARQEGRRVVVELGAEIPAALPGGDRLEARTSRPHHGSALTRPSRGITRPTINIALAAGLVPAASHVAYRSPSVVSSRYLKESKPYTGRRAGPSRSDRPMRGNHMGSLSYLFGAAHSTVDDQAGRHHEPRLVGGEVERRVRDVLRLPQVVGELPLADRGHAFFGVGVGLLQVALDERRQDRAGQPGVDPDARWRGVDLHRLRH